MRKLTLLVLCLVLVGPGVLQAQEQGDAATAQILKSSPICVRFPSLDRMDALIKEFLPFAKAMGAPAHDIEPLEKNGFAAWFFAETGLPANVIDKSKPIYLGIDPNRGEPLVVFHAAEGATIDGQAVLKDEPDVFAAMRGRVVVVGEKELHQAEVRGTPTALLDGDACVHVYLSDLTTRYKEQIDGGFAMALMQLGGFVAALPEPVQKVLQPTMSAVKAGVYSLESMDYALTWKDGKLWSEGLVRTKARSPFKTLLQRAGAPGDATDLTGYLPKDAFLTFDGCGNPDWPGKEFNELIDAAMGEGTGKALAQVLSPDAHFTPYLTGRAAGAVSLTGMAGSTIVIAELKPATDVKKMFADFDMTASNAALKNLGVPIAINLEKAVAKHGETELHKLTMQSENFQIAMFAGMMQTMIAAEGGHLFLVTSPTAHDDIAGLLDQVRKGEKVAHPHAAAMARLGRTRNFGMTINIGALKPLAMMLGMFAPEAAQIAGQIPDDLSMSTAVSIVDGNIHWRGDWPVKEITKLVEAAFGTKKKKAADDDFD